MVAAITQDLPFAGIARYAIALLSLLFIAGCQPQTAHERYQAGYKDGYEEARVAGTSTAQQQYKEGWDAGYSEAYALFRPAEDSGDDSITTFTRYLTSLLGAVKVIISILIAIVLLIENSQTDIEKVAKTLFAVLGALAALVLGPLVGAGSAIESLLLIPSPTSTLGALFWISSSAVVTYIVFLVVGFLVEDLSNVKEAAWCIFFLSAIAAVLALPLFSFFTEAPETTRYFGSTVLNGVFIGGVAYFSLKVLNEAAKQRRAIEKAEEKSDKK